MNSILYILTYSKPHKKTQDLLFTLKAKGICNVHVLSTPWKDRKNFVPLIPHRPLKAIEVSLPLLCDRLEFKYTQLESINDMPSLNDDDLVLIGGAGILPSDIANSGKVVNSHPAYLPYTRGLDSYKWAVYHDNPIGVTTHIISEECDAGKLIRREFVPLYSWDTFHSVANRQYELEISMLADSINDIKTSDLKELSTTRSKPMRRMPHSMEVRLLERFKNMIDRVEAG